MPPECKKLTSPAPALRSPVSAQADTQTQSPRLPPQPKPSSHTNTPPPPLSATFLGQELSDAESESEESSSSDDDKPSPAPTQLKRFGKFSVSRSRPSPADLDEDEPPAFLPFSDRDSKSTIMQPATNKPKHQLPQPLQPQQPAQSSNASSTSASSGVAVSAATRSPPDHGSRSQSGGGGNGSSPRRTHGREQPLMSPHRRAVRREDSDTPSMGSSFSDLEGMMIITILCCECKAWLTYRGRHKRDTLGAGGGADEQYPNWRHGEPDEYNQSGVPQPVFLGPCDVEGGLF